MLLRPELLLLGALLPLMALLYFKRRQVLEYRVPSLEFWEEAVREKQGIRVRPIDRYLLLLLQLLAGLLMVLAATGPVWVHAFTGDRVTIALDGSLSMNALEEGGVRFDAARTEARKILRSLPADSAVTLAVLDEGVREPVTDAAPGAALAALDGLTCASRPLDADFASEYLAALPGTVILVSDKELPLGDRLVRVGAKRLDNVGITRAHYDYYSGHVFFTLFNYAPDPGQVVVSLWEGGRQIDAATLLVPASARAEASFGAPDAAGPLTLKIESRDMLAQDNVYLVPAGEPGKTRVLLSGGDFFLEKALSAMAEVALERHPNNPPGAENHQVVILAGGPEAAGGEAGVWIMAPDDGMLLPGRARDEQLKAAPGPLTENLVLRDVMIREASLLADKEGWQRVLETSGGGAVMAAGFEGGKRILVSTIDFTATNLVMLPDFPVLVSNIVNWLAGPPELAGNPPPALVTGTGQAQAARDARGLQPLFSPLGRICAGLALLLLVAEWEVYRREL